MPRDREAWRIEGSFDMPKKRKPRKLFRPWRWFSGGSDVELYDITAPENGESGEHAAMEEALELTDELPEDADDKPAPREMELAGVPKSHLENMRARTQVPTPGVVVQTPARGPRPGPAEGSKSKSSSRQPGHRARLQVEARPSAQITDALGLDGLAETIAAAGTRDEAVREILSYMAGHFRRVAIFSVRQDQATGWFGAGPGFFPERVAKAAIPLGRSSIFSKLASDPSAFVAEIVPSPDNAEIYAFLEGTIPSAALVVPVTLRDRLVSILYADNENEPLAMVDMAVWKRIAEMMAISFEIMILKAKMRG